MHRPRRLVPPLLVALAFVVLAVTVAACGWTNESKEAAEGEPVHLDELKYNVIFSRFLNRNDNEDSAYLVGQPAPRKGSSYFGVFLEVQNKSEENQTLADEFSIKDAGDQEFSAIPAESLYAFSAGGELEPQEPIPAPDSTPQKGPIEGSLVLFELPADASENRPLTLFIGSDEGPAEITLDL